MSILRLLPLLGAALAASGQDAAPVRPAPPAEAGKSELQSAAEKLRQAGQGLDVGKAKGTAQGLLQNLPGGVSDAAKAALQSPELKSQATDAAKAAAQRLLPEAQKLIRQPGAGSPAAAAGKTAPASAEGPQPQALQPISETAMKGRQPTVIIEADQSVFDLNAAIFIYSGHVRARHPQFYIECEELVVHMVKEETGKEAKKPAAKQDPILSKQGQKPRESGIKLAIASGPMVVIEKRAEAGDVQRGNCKRLVYEAATGDITLSNFPQVQRGDVLHIATDADTVMRFDKNGKLHTTGRTRTVKVGGEEPAPGTAAPGVTINGQ